VSSEAIRRLLWAARRDVRARITHMSRTPHTASVGNRRSRSLRCSRFIFTRQEYHERADPSQEAPGLRTEARREAGVLHEARNGTIDREKDAGCVCLLVQEWMVQVEEPAQRNTASLTPSSSAGEGQSHLDKRRMAPWEQTEKPS
jgi:hypothetical protein